MEVSDQKQMGIKKLFTSESVTEGHPDKMCDIISDAVLDAYLEKDPFARVACEVTAACDTVTVMGEITSDAEVDVKKIVKDVIAKVGYTQRKYEFDADTCKIQVLLNTQSKDIDMGVTCPMEIKEQIEKEDNQYDKIGAGDQGMMFGYACNETSSYMPAAIHYAHKLCKRLCAVRKQGILPYLGPDGKSMVTFEYLHEKPIRIDTIVISTQHSPEIQHEMLYEDIKKHVIEKEIESELLDSETKIFVNPTGRFVHGGPCADSGLTGRKIIVDTYGGTGRHGGGAFSGKDPTKVDRTGAYAARYVAKNIVAAKIAQKCEVEIAYAIGIANPVSIHVDTFHTSSVPEEEIIRMISQIFDLRPAAIIEQFQMRRPIYKQFASYGHFGRNELDAKWEKTDKTDEIQTYFGMN